MEKEVFEYLDKVVTIKEGRLAPIDDNITIATQLNLGGLPQVIASKFGREKVDIYFLTLKWSSQKLKNKAQ